MREVTIQPTFASWQETARRALHDEIAPREILWRETTDAQAALGFDDNVAGARVARPFTVPAEFVRSAEIVSRHSSNQKWPLLYRVLWRLTHGESHLLRIATDADVIALQHLRREVEKDAYRMRAFLRFRETHPDAEPWFVAWYEPEHDTVAMNEEFFVQRFANMRWSILTPKRCMHWDRTAVRFSDGIDKPQLDADDAERLWIRYYSSIFNPARIKPAAMQAQLLKRNWKNLPEAAVIEPLLRNARHRSEGMIDRSEFLRVRNSDYSIAQPPVGDLDELRGAAAGCRACPLWKNATCTVFGEGDGQARVVLVGEQPGDQEDRAGKPFVGPAGQVLDRALAAAGVIRGQMYVTNAVKHFKFEPRGKRRIHKTASPREIAACRPWLAAEMRVVQPDLIVALGATAARSIFNTPVRVTQERGRILDSEFGKTLITIHPSALLRLPEGVSFDAEFERFVADLSLIAAAMPVS